MPPTKPHGGRTKAASSSVGASRQPVAPQASPTLSVDPFASPSMRIVQPSIGPLSDAWSGTAGSAVRTVVSVMLSRGVCWLGRSEKLFASSRSAGWPEHRIPNEIGSSSRAFGLSEYANEGRREHGRGDNAQGEKAQYPEAAPGCCGQRRRRHHRRLERLRQAIALNEQPFVLRKRFQVFFEALNRRR